MKTHSVIQQATGLVLGLALVAAMGLSFNAVTRAATPESLSDQEKQRLIVLGAAVGETVYALGAGEHVVARDLSCQRPEDLAAKPAVGYHRALSAEGVLSLNPTAIIATSEAGPPNVIDQLDQSNLRLVRLDNDYTLPSLQAMIRKLGGLLSSTAKAEEMIAGINEAVQAVPEVTPKRQVLFLLSSPGSNRYMAAGTGTAADAMIRLAGGENLFADMPGYKPVSAEIMTDRSPDVVLVAAGGNHGDMISPERLAESFPFLAESPAATEGRFANIDLSQFLTFGPRTGEAALQLHEIIYQ